MFHTEHAADICAPTRRTVYSLNFILTAVVALITYFNTALLLSRGVPEEAIGMVYALGSLASLLLLFAAPKIFTRIGNYRALAICGTIASLALVLLAVVPDMGGAIALFILWSSVMTLVYLLLDMILEGSMRDEGSTGKSRGLFVSMANAAWFIFPVAGGALAAISFGLLYLAAALASFIGLAVALVLLKGIRNHIYTPIHLSRTIRFLAMNKDLRLVFIAQFLLRLFFSAMVIYVPIFLLVRHGISLETFGSIISVAMLAYIFLEWPAGKMADEYWGEKEMMAVGFLILAVTTAALAFVSGPVVIVFGGLLFLTRVGAALVDVTTESYFFKQVSGADADMVSTFRMLGPLSYIAGPVLASALLFVAPLSYLFPIFGALMLLGIPVALALRDTR